MKIEIEEECLSKQQWFDKISHKAREMEKQWKKMQKVPGVLRVKQREHFEPLLVSIGPYHHGKDHLKTMENLKPLVATIFLGKDRINDVFNTFESKIKSARVMEYYEWEIQEPGNRSTPNDNELAEKAKEDEFIRMMFLDGCFVLHLIHCYTHQVFGIELHSYKAFLQQDLFLLENQLPFIVLETLLSVVTDEAGKERRLKVIYKYIQDNTGARKPPSVKKFRALWSHGGIEGGQPLHLLQMLRAQLIGKEHDPGSPHSWLRQILQSDSASASEDPEGCTDELRCETRYFVRGAKELDDVGIVIKPSEESTLKQVHFASYKLFSQLTLPPMAVDDTTKRKYLNLIAYEMGQYQHTDQSATITSYICFMDSLIDSPEDVRMLRRKGVLNNFLASDEAVAELFNTIAHDLIPDHVYAEVESHIQQHFRKTWMTWVAQMTHDHFSTPWTVVGFLAAIFAILLSATQTYFTIFPRSSEPKKEPKPTIKPRLRKKLMG